MNERQISSNPDSPESTNVLKLFIVFSYYQMRVSAENPALRGILVAHPSGPQKHQSGSQEDFTARVRLSQDMPHRVFRGWTLLDSLIKQGLLSFTKDRQNNSL